MSGGHRGRLLVVGAERDSLGHAVAVEAHHQGWLVVCAGMNVSNYDKDWPALYCDVLDEYSVNALFDDHGPFDSVVYCAGVNHSGFGLFDKDVNGASLAGLWSEEWRVNCAAPMKMLRAWVLDRYERNLGVHVWHHYVVVSSNSAHVARSGSLGYCASKAAVSHAVRCAARDASRHPDIEPAVYCYEPGLLATKATDRLAGRLGMDVDAMTRIPDGGGPIHPLAVASIIVSNMKEGGRALHGATLRIDGGDQ